MDHVRAPGWRAFIDELVERWRRDAPAFDAAALRDELLSAPAAEEIAGHVVALGERDVTRPDGSTIMRLDDPQAEHRRWLAGHAAESLPALLLGLRHHDNGAQMAIEALLGEASLPRDRVMPALLSVLEYPGPNSAREPVQHMPTWAIVRLGPPAPEQARRLVGLLKHEDFRVAGAAATVLAELAHDDALFEPLWAMVDRARREDAFAWSLMRAAEVRRDPVMRPFLQWMQKSRKFRSGGYRERIQEALDNLEKR